MAGRMGHTYRTVQEAAQPVIPQPLGTSPHGVPLIGGMDGVVTSVAAAAQEIQNAAKELKILNQRQLQMYGHSANSPGDLAHAISTAMTNAIDTQTRALTQMLPQMSGGQPTSTVGLAPIPLSSIPAAPAPAIPNAHEKKKEHPLISRSLALLSGASIADDLDERSKGQPTSVARHRQPSQQELSGGAPHMPGDHDAPLGSGFIQGGHFSIGNVRKDLGARVQTAMTGRGPKLAQDGNGDWRHLDDKGAATGVKASSREVSEFRAIGAVKGAAQGLAEGGSLRAAGAALLPEGLMAGAGIAGAGIFALKEAGDFAVSQRAANAQWQSMMGGSQGDAFGERARSKMFQLGQFGVMSGSDASALYQGVAATGMNRSQRGVAQDFAVSNYRDLGMSIQDSMDLVNTASKTGQESLAGLANALKDVTTTAKEAGVNTQVARQQFGQTWKSISDTFGGGASGKTSITEARGFTDAKTALGRKFQDVNVDPTNLHVMQMVASNNHETVDQLIAQSAEKNGQTKYAGMYTKSAQNLIDSGLTDQGLAIIRNTLHGKSIKTLSEGQQSQLESDIRKSTNFNSQSMIGMLGQAGITGVSLDNSLGMAIRVATGDYNPGEATKQVAAKDRTKKIDPYSHSSGIGGFLTAPLKSRYSDSYNQIKDEVNSRSKHSAWSQFTPWANDAMDAAGSFLSDVQKTGRIGGISQTLAESTHNGTDMAKSVEVMAGGKKRVVSLSDAMKYFRDQVDRGTATIAEGDNKGQSVADATQMVGDSHVKVTSDKNKDLSGKGQSISDWNKNKHDSAPNKNDIVVHPSADLLRLIRATQNGVNLDPSAGWGPVANHVTANGRPSGSVNMVP